MDLDGKIKKVKAKMATNTVNPKKLYEDAEVNLAKVAAKLDDASKQLETARDRLKELESEHEDLTLKLQQARELKAEALNRLVAANKPAEAPVALDPQVNSALAEARAILREGITGLGPQAHAVYETHVAAEKAKGNQPATIEVWFWRSAAERLLKVLPAQADGGQGPAIEVPASQSTRTEQPPRAVARDGGQSAPETPSRSRSPKR